MTHPTPWRDCLHPALRMVSCRYAKDPTLVTAPTLADLIKASLALGDGHHVAVCAGCGMRWYRVQRLALGRDPWTNDPINRGGE